LLAEIPGAILADVKSALRIGLFASSQPRY
jgi:hypothetical protein